MDILNGTSSPVDQGQPELLQGSVYSDGGYISHQDASPGYSEPTYMEEELDIDGYQPTYADAFPPLPSSNSGDGQRGANQNNSKWRPATSCRSSPVIAASSITQVFRVPLEERRYKTVDSPFGDDRQGQTCRDVMAKTGAAIEVSSPKDQSLTILVTGKPDAVAQARRMILTQLQTQASIDVSIPRDHHKFILGRGGKVLQQLELATATKITMPRDGSDTIRIVGTKEGVDRARHEIQLKSDEQAKLSFERLPIPKIYHPFIAGANNATAKKIMEQTGARINIPPPSVNKDELTVAGEKEGVAIAIKTINDIFEEKKRKTTTVSIEVRKSQHKYVIGPRAQTLQEILALTGISVEMPPTESESETITLRGEPDKLGGALTQVYEKANSVVFAEVAAPQWLHRFIIGRKGQNIRKITQDLPKVHVEFSDEKDTITLEGPPQEVERAREALETFTRELKASMAFAEISVDQKFHPHIIGKNGANVNRIKSETGTSILIPSNNEKSNVIRIEGSPKGVEIAKEEIMHLAKKLENEKSRDVIIEHRFHRAIIGAKGEKIKEVRDKYPEVQVSFPDPGKKSDVVTLRGPRGDVDKVYAYMNKLNAELKAANYCVEIPIFKQFHKNVIGRGGATIKKIREETDTKIDLPSEGSDSDVIVITGHKAQVEQAREKILAIQNELANVTQLEISVPHKLHTSIIGAKGRLIRSIMEECGGVSVKFPAEGSNSDKIIIRGPKDDADKAKKQLLQLANEKELASFSAELRAKPEHHRFLIGRGGTNIRKVREKTGARIVFPSAKDDDKELITIIGKKEAVEAAKQDLMKAIKELDNIVEGDVHVDPKHHKHFVAKRGEVLREIADEYGGVAVSFPRSGANSDRVVLKGAKDCVEGAKQRILEIVNDLDSMVTIECVIPQKHHRALMGPRGANVQNVTTSNNVQIKFPDRDMVNGSAETQVVNGDHPEHEPPPSPQKCDIIVITGKKDDCEAAKEDLLALVPIMETMTIPFDYHRFIIGAKGVKVREMMTRYDVNIAIPPAREESDTVVITGTKSNVENAIHALQLQVADIEAENEDRALRSFKMEVHVDHRHHPKIIGRKGKVIQKIRDDHDVMIQFPSLRGGDGDVVDENRITLIGYEQNCEAARSAIDRIVKELEDQVSMELDIDPRVHRRLIGGKGRAIRQFMDKYHVDIRFPRPNSSEMVVVTGLLDDVEEAKEQLLLLEEEYMQDVHEEIAQHDLVNHYLNPPSKQQSNQAHEFVVRDAPWNKKSSEAPAPPDTSNIADFPAISSAAAPRTAAWGPSRR